MDVLRQFGLLFTKNLILAWRYKLWTILEFVVPIIVTVPIIIFISTHRYDNYDFDYTYIPSGNNLTGTSEDFYFHPNFDCLSFANNRNYSLIGAYYAAENPEVALEIMQALQLRYPYRSSYQNNLTTMNIQQFASMDKMTQAMVNADPNNYYDDDNYENSGTKCGHEGYAFGIRFDQIDIANRNLKYTMAFTSGYYSVNSFKFNKNWLNPYQDTYPEALDQYKSWSTLYFGIDSIWTEKVTNKKVQPIVMRATPRPNYKSDLMQYFMYFLPLAWGMCSFIAVVHGSREITQEKGAVRDFLAVMGLNTFMFYYSHIFFTWLKCIIIFICCAIPIVVAVTNVSWTLFFVAMILYALGAVTFGALIASLFVGANTTLKVVVILWTALIGVTYVYPPAITNVGLCFVYSININGAFFYVSRIIQLHMQQNNSHIGWGQLFENGSTEFTIGFALIMLVVDVIWMTALMFFFDFATGNVEFSFRSLFFCCKSERDMKKANQIDDSYENSDHLEKMVPDLEVKDLVKVWLETGERAVDGISLRAYRGHVTVLLGHNGAGKSTTFSALCGLIKATSGKIRVCQENVAFKTTRKNLGLCPQSNPLFDRLTVNEHLWLVNGLKGAKGDYKEEGRGYLKHMVLLEKENEESQRHFFFSEWAINLSGGMKRKLCVAMALIGRSPVVLFDEPTAGMDPGARRDIERLLEVEKQSRTILLTTHYMDEAETLGDRIAIMSRGRIVTCGSPQFLKQRFGTGYILSIVVDEKKDGHKLAEELLPMTKQFIPTVNLGDVHGRQIELYLPKEEQSRFPDIFDMLESKKDEMGISGFGLSINTLEQVFVRVCELAEPTSADEAEKIQALNQELIRSQKDERHIGPVLWIGQLYSILLKRCLYTYRNWPQLISQVFFPLLIFTFITILSQLNKTTKNSGSRTFDVKGFGRTEILVQIMHNSPIATSYENLLSQWEEAQRIDVPPQQNMSKAFLSRSFDYPPVGMGAVFGESITNYYNDHALHSVITSLNFMDNAILKSFGDHGSITAGIYLVRSQTSDNLGTIFSTDIINNILAPLIVIAMALLTSTFIMFLIEERRLKFTHQQSLTGISPIVFWLGTILYDLIFYAIMCGLFIIFFVAGKWLTEYIGNILLLWMLYFWACMPFIYSVSFLFTNASKANILLILYQLVAPLAALLLIVIVQALQSLARKNNHGDGISGVTYFFIDVLLCLIPSLGLGYGFFIMASFKLLHPDTYKLLNIWAFKYLGRDVMFMIIFGAVVWGLFFVFQFKIVRQTWYRMFNRASKDSDNFVEDPDVTKERSEVEMNANSKDLALEVKDLCKSFGKLKAVDHLTMGIRNGECFGLLGVNGSGKTTTFDILTGQSFSTSGTAKIDGQTVTDHLAMGYCPQFDALLLDLTGRETLMILARQYGFKNPARKAQLVLNAVGLSEHKDKLVRHYSGGQRRKLSVGLALLATTRIIILDEPTAGIDPKSRRDIWEVLTAVRDHSESAILLTSHSMDECEALCSRIAVLSKGHMVAIGTSQYLKSKYGNSYSLTIVAQNIDQKTEICAKVQTAIPEAILKTPADSNTLTMKWQIPRSSTDQWSVMFSRCQHLASDSNARDFCLAQSTLEETFLVISNYDEIVASQTQTVGRQQSVVPVTVQSVPTVIQQTPVTTQPNIQNHGYSWEDEKEEDENMLV